MGEHLIHNIDVKWQNPGKNNGAPIVLPGKVKGMAYLLLLSVFFVYLAFCAPDLTVFQTSLFQP